MSLEDDFIFLVISTQLQKQSLRLLEYLRVESDALCMVRKSEGADGGHLCTRDFPHSVGPS